MIRKDNGQRAQGGSKIFIRPTVTDHKEAVMGILIMIIENIYVNKKEIKRFCLIFFICDIRKVLMVLSWVMPNV